MTDVRVFACGMSNAAGAPGGETSTDGTQRKFWARTIKAASNDTYLRYNEMRLATSIGSN